MSENDMKLTPGINDDRYASGINDGDDDDLDLDLDEDDDDWDDDDEENDQDDGSDDEEDSHRKVKGGDDDNKKVDWKKKFYSTTNLQNRKIASLENELKSIKKPADLTESEIAKLKEKYDEEDLDVIEKIIERKAQALIEKNQSTNLAQKELNIFLKEHPELSSPELKHIQSLQRDFGYSLKKAYTVLFGRHSESQAKAKHKVSSSFGGDAPSKSNTDRAKSEDDKARNDMDQFLWG